MISPCIDILRQLATQIHSDLGLRQGRKHSPLDLTRDIQELMRSLRENGIYAAEDGRITSPEKPCVHNTISQALRSLAETVRETVRERTRERTGTGQGCWENGSGGEGQGAARRAGT